METELTWKVMTTLLPEFVQWIVQKYGPLPEGPIKQTDYERFKKEYNGKT